MADKKQEFYDILSQIRLASKAMAIADTKKKDEFLGLLAKRLVDKKDEIQTENNKDLENGKASGLPAAMLDRLTLTDARIQGMADALQQIIALPDPVGDVYDFKTRPSGIRVGRMRVPLGVIGIIFESRPNVVVDAAALCLKSGNAVVLRGGSEAKHSNRVLGKLIEQTLVDCDLPQMAAYVIPETDRELVMHLLKARGLVDLVIPRGGEGLIRFVDQNASVPIILHYKGVCHVFVDKDADLDKALPIVMNAKVQRPGVCNALETLLVHKSVADTFLPTAAKALIDKGVKLNGCEAAREIVPEMNPATDEDWPAEYLDLELAVKVVDGFDDATAHIQKYGSEHSEAIITENYSRAGRFMREVMASCILVNASTRFNDGGELGLGAEIGISTTKLHAFGPMGLEELTTSKFIVLGTGQVRQ